jgi:hypothetical protein
MNKTAVAGLPSFLEGAYSPFAAPRGATTVSQAPVDKYPTKATAAAVAHLIQALWPQIIGGSPTSSAVTLLVTQMFAETSLAGTYNNNPGNLTVTSGPYYVTGGKNQSHFGSYDTLEQGVAAYLQRLNTRWPAALEGG